MSTVRTVATPHGQARLVGDRSRHPQATLLLSHGAGGGIEAADLEALAQALPRVGVTVVRLEQPWRVAGKKVAPAPAALDEALVCAANAMRPRTPLVLGGRSAGARSAARCARELGASGCLALAFPLHPPGRPERSRLQELRDVGLPTLVVQGDRDPFGRPEEFPADQEVVVVPGADHALRPPKRGELTAEEGLALVVEATVDWIVREVVGNQNSARGVRTGVAPTSREGSPSAGHLSSSPGTARVGRND